MMAVPSGFQNGSLLAWMSGFINTNIIPDYGTPWGFSDVQVQWGRMTASDVAALGGYIFLQQEFPSVLQLLNQLKSQLGGEASAFAALFDYTPASGPPVRNALADLVVILSTVPFQFPS